MAFGDFTVDRNSTKYVLGSGGTIISYATDEPAFEFNADGSYKGLLVEPAATNICLQSQNFTSTWAQEGLTSRLAVSNTLTGLTDANELVEDSSASAQHRVYQTITIASGTVYTASVYVKRGVGTRQFAIIAVDAGLRVYYDLGTGTVGDETNGTGEILDMGNGWYRCSATGTSTTTSTTIYLAICDGTTSGSETYNGDGSSSLILYGAQLETGPIATSYIPTTTASVTRNADEIYLDSVTSLIGQTEGTLYVEVDWSAFVIGASSLNFVSLMPTAATDAFNNAVQIGVVTGTNRVRGRIAGGTDDFAQELNPTTAGIYKLALPYEEDNSAFYANGSIVGSVDTSVDLPSSLDKIYFGRYTNFNNGIRFHLRAVALFTRRLSDAEAQALTTL